MYRFVYLQVVELELYSEAKRKITAFYVTSSTEYEDQQTIKCFKKKYFDDFIENRRNNYFSKRKTHKK